LPCRCLAIAWPLPAVSLAVSSPLLPLPPLPLVYCSLSHFFFLPAAFVAVIIFHGLLCFDTSLVAGGACWLSKDILLQDCFVLKVDRWRAFLSPEIPYLSLT